MKKKLFFTAFALALFAGCSDNDYVGDQASLNAVTGNGAIAFSSNTPGITRATQEDATAASTLGNKFIVWGEKNESNGTAATAGNTVFQNYTVEYTASTAYTTLSNTNDWEYVGKTSYGTKLTPNAPTSQTIKYWDNGASSYTFTALSALDADITGDKVVITKNTSGSTAFDKGYTIAVKENASSANIFFADRINDAPANLRNSAVKFSFRNLQAKLRFGIYETVPGYTVKIKQVGYNSTTSTTNFGVDGKFIKPGESTSFTVTYGDGTTGPLNKALVAVSGSSSTDTYLASTSTTIISATSIGTASNTATLDDYVSILPYTSNTTDLSFTIDYTLKSEDTNEIIEITGKTVKVPAAYCQWKSNYAYTYLFKITDSDLTPITFDACYVEDENGNQETITTVENPSITTYAKGEVVTANNEYLTSSNIYVVVDKGGTVQVLTVGTNANLYTAEIEAGAAQGITEETVKNAIAVNSDGYDAGTILENGTSLSGYYTYDGSSYSEATGTADGTTKYYLRVTASVKDANGKKLVVKAAAGLTATSSIPAADSPTGVAIDLDGTNNKCAKFTPAAAGNYVFEFIDTADSNKKYYKVIKVVSGS